MFPLVCIGGPTGAGKDTIVNAFLPNNPGFTRVPRTTTRAPRPGEIEGFHYHFLTLDEFRDREERGLICAIDVFCGERYGIDLKRIIDAFEERKQVIGVFGVCSYGLREIYGEKALLVYISAPIHLLRDRLTSRGDSPHDVLRRTRAAEKQLEEEPEHFDHIIQNVSSVSYAVKRLEDIISR